MAGLIQSVRPSGKPLDFGGRGRRTTAPSGKCVRQMLGVLADGQGLSGNRPPKIRRTTGGRAPLPSCMAGECESPSPRPLPSLVSPGSREQRMDLASNSP